MLTRLADRISFAPDAGFYYLLPQAVVRPVSEAEIIALFRYSHQQRIPIVFRTGGTSLSGQAVTDGILADLSQHWKQIKVEQDGQLVRVQPGITGAMVNTHLKKYQRKIGPDPSSIVAAMMGGILSNNASGMCCGTKLNSYHTTQYIRFILPDGNTFSTENKGDYARFESSEPQLFAGLAQIRENILQDAVLYDKIRNKYQLKTTIGYSLNAFVDFEHPLDIFAHLLVGAEGTLGFIAEAVLQTVPDPVYKSTAMLYFYDIRQACDAITPLTEAGAVMVELMDRASLRAVESIEGIDPFIKSLPGEACALLVEFQDSDQQQLLQTVDAFLQTCGSFNLIQFPSFTVNDKERDFLWKIRKGLFPSVGAVRKRGTTVILEDIAFPVQHLGSAITSLQLLFTKHQYTNAIIFGHAKDGNIHFVVTQAFDTAAEVTRYDMFIRDVVALVVDKYGGTLKAEHGTGRNMAPFVETEWGGVAYDIMKTVKQLADPHGLLNPGVIINDNPNAHLANLKELPQVEEEVDKCIECGYCEPACPSRDFTTSPRRRIVMRRALAKFKAQGNKKEHDELAEQFKYDGIETCAVDGLCAGSCPVNINTGELVKRLRRESHSSSANAVALFVAKHFGKTEYLVRTALKAGGLMNKVAGKNTMVKLTAAIKKIDSQFPLWSNQLTASPSMRWAKKADAGVLPGKNGTVVYFASCISRMMGNYTGKPLNSMECFMSICQKNDIAVKLPPNLRSSCCSQMFSSKGYKQAYQYKANEIVQQLWQATEGGKWPVVIDVSSCAYSLKNIQPALTDENKIHYAKLQIQDVVEFLYKKVLPVCQVTGKKKNVVLHPVCSLEKMNISFMLKEVAARFADTVTVPASAGCCGMAGDRGFIVPGLTKSATNAEAKEVCQQQYDGYYSSTKTCEIALSHATMQNYESILYLVNEYTASLT